MDQQGHLNFCSPCSFAPLRERFLNYRSVGELKNQIKRVLRQMINQYISRKPPYTRQVLQLATKTLVEPFERHTKAYLIETHV